MHPNGKECLKITIKDNGAGEYAADTKRKWESRGSNLYFGGYGLDSRMIRFGNSQTGAPGLLAFLWEKAGVKVGKNENNEDNTDDFYQMRYNEDGWGSPVTLWLPQACFKNTGAARKDGGSLRDNAGADAVGDLALIEKSVRLFSRAEGKSRKKTLATVYATGMDERDDLVRKIIWFRPAEIDDFSLRQCIAAAEALSRASDLVRKELGI